MKTVRNIYNTATVKDEKVLKKNSPFNSLIIFK